jgi:hypothetical protein
VAEPHAAEAYRGDFQSVAERSLVHRCPPYGLRLVVIG